jgi:dipeptidyl aminopeptidase/acylaminoacyl peptidase
MVHRHDEAAGGGGLWVIDTARGTTSKLTFDTSHNVTAQWSPDGKEVAFTSNREGGIFNIYKKISTGAGPDEVVLKSPESKALTDWSPDGRFLVYAAEGPKTALDLWVLPLVGDRKPTLFLRTEASEGMGRLSPDGRWMAYVSNETGRNEVYVQPFPASGAKWLVSTGGGTQPRWAVDGSALYYLATGSAGMMTMTTVDVRAIGSVFEAARPKALFPAPLAQVQAAGLSLVVTSVQQSYAVSKDGQRFFTLSTVPDITPPAITVVMNWADAVRK